MACGGAGAVWAHVHHPSHALLPPPLGILDRPGISGVLHSAASICMRWHAALSSAALKHSRCPLASCAPVTTPTLQTA